jgi:HEAT repeat protein
MARVYVSSTFDDLKEHRAQVRLALQRMGHEDVAMERYGATDQRPVEKCLADAAAADVYVGIFAFRYGFIPEGYDRSITELEYRRAVDAGKPALIFLLHEDADWPFSKVEKNALHRIEALRAELAANHIVAFFKDASELRALVSEAMGNWERERGLKPARGLRDWEAYREAVFKAHRWVRLAVIAGAKHDRITQIPLAEVFVPQTCQPGQPLYEVPEEVLRFRRELFEQARAAGQEEAAAAEAEAGEAGPAAELDLTFPESVLGVLLREKTQVVLGGPGSGKSTLMLYVMLSLSDAEAAGCEPPTHSTSLPVPFLIELRQYVLKGAPDFNTYLAANTKERYGVATDPEDLARLFEGPGRALVIFDGLDEVFDPARRAKVVEQFEAFARAYPEVWIIVTSRIVGYEAAELKVAGFQHYTLLDFGVAQIRQFVPRWYRFYTWEGDERDAASLVQRIAESPRLTELAGNPLLLTMMAVIYKHQDLPEQRWKLYERCTEVLLEDWDIKRKSLDLKTVLPLDINIRGPQKAEILQRVSTYMLEHGQPGRELNAIAYQPLMTILARYLQEKYNKSPGDAEATAKGILLHLRERTYILAEVGEGIFGFVHRTFMEYFAASHILADFNARKSDYKWLTEEVFAGWWRDDWQEVLRLLIGMLSDQNSPVAEVIEYLRMRWHVEPPTNLAFAAKCLAETTPDPSDPIARNLLNELVGHVARYSELEGAEAASFVDNGFLALSSLGPQIGPTVESRAIISQLEQHDLRSRKLAWQLGLTLRSKRERLDYALAALTDKDEAVRRGAIAALERDWPNNEAVADALLNLIRRDNNSRVRQAAIEAFQRSWPRDARILRAIESRLGKKPAYTDLLWTVDYLAANWRGNTEALRLLVNLPRQNLAETDYDSVRLSAAEAIANGWYENPDASTLLREIALNDTNVQTRITAVTALSLAWSKEVETRSLFQHLVIKGAGKIVRRVALLALMDYPLVSNSSLVFLSQLSFPLADGLLKYYFEEHARTLKERGLGGPEMISVLKNRLMNDDDANIRNLAGVILRQLE